MIELCARSSFSFLVGSDTPADLVSRAKTLGYDALGLLDEASVAGSVRAHLAGLEQDLHILHGSRFVTTEGIELMAWVLDAGVGPRSARPFPWPDAAHPRASTPFAWINCMNIHPCNGVFGQSLVLAAKRPHR